MVGLGYFLLAPLSLLVLNGGYSIPMVYNTSSRYSNVDLSGGEYLVPMLVIWGSLLLTFGLIIALTPPAGPNSAPGLHLNEQKLKRIILLTFGIAIADYAIMIWVAGGIESFLISHWYLRQEELFTRFADRYVLYTYLSQANHVIFVGAAALYTASLLQRNKWDWRFGGLLVFALILQMVMTGNRIFIASYGLAFLTSCWIYERKKLILVLVVLLPGVLLFFSAWAHLRGNLSVLSENIPTFLEEELGNRTVATLMDTTEGPSVMQLLHVINDFGYDFDYLYGSTYAKAILFAVPRSIYPSKSSNFPVILARLYEPGEVTSLGGTQLAELYGNFGIFSMLLLPMITFLILWISERMARQIERPILLSAILFLLCIWFARSSFEDNFITFLFVLLLMQGLRLRGGLCLAP
jgi:oligosaccharide repeat unit polymerase